MKRNERLFWPEWRRVGTWVACRRACSCTWRTCWCSWRQRTWWWVASSTRGTGRPAWRWTLWCRPRRPYSTCRQCWPPPWRRPRGVTVETPSRRGAFVAVNTMVNCNTLHDQIPSITLHRSRLYFTCKNNDDVTGECRVTGDTAAIAFAAAGPGLWNSLTSHLKEADLS